MKRIFVKELPGKSWNEVHRFDLNKQTLCAYTQHKEMGFTYSFCEYPIGQWGYSSIDSAIKQLSRRGMLGQEVDDREQIESEVRGWANAAAKTIKDKGGRDLCKMFLTICVEKMVVFYNLSTDEANREIDLAVLRLGVLNERY